MILIGEKLNSSIPSAKRAYEGKDEDIIEIIKSQSEAHYLDLNTATVKDEAQCMIRTVELIKKYSHAGIVLDSPNPDVIARVVEKCGIDDLCINSVTLDKRINELSPIIAQLGCKVIALPEDSMGIPASAAERVTVAGKIIEKLAKAGIRESNIFVDLIIESVAVNPDAARTALDTLTLVKREFPKVKTVCGASNISFGLPKRAKINAAFITCAAYLGLDSAILDTTNPDIMTAVKCADVISGNDEYCMEYISYIRGE